VLPLAARRTDSCTGSITASTRSVTRRSGRPGVTTPARTLLDLAAILDRRRLHRALDQTEILELTDYPALDAIARSHASHKGASKLRRALTEHTAGTALTRSDLEERFLALCRGHGLPTPQVNTTVAGHEVDFLIADARLVVETDGWRYHRTQQAFERDRRRDAVLIAHGYRTLRLTHNGLTHDQTGVVAALTAVLRD
jgi:very-short-patch-repair endonuclease